MRKLMIPVAAAPLAAAAIGMSAPAQGYEWCPDGGEPIDRLGCVEITETDGNYGRLEIQNLCGYRVIVHSCTRDPAVAGHPQSCPEPPAPRGSYELEPAGQHGDGYFFAAADMVWWVVSCE